MKATVVIPVRDGAAVIGRCLGALRRQVGAGELEVIVVDDGSRDDTAARVAAFPEVRLLRQEPAGPAAARNRGLAAAHGEVILFTDADCAPLPGWAAALLQALSQHGADGAKGTYVSVQRGLVARFVQLEYELKYRRLARYQQIDFVDTYSAAYRREALQAVGGFDERYPTASVEDQELSFRLAERGYKLVFAPEAVVAHLHADSVRAYARKKWRIGYWKAAVLRRHPTKAQSDTHTPQAQKVEIALLGALGAGLLATGAHLPLWPWPAACAAGLLATWAPMLAHIARRDAPVLVIAPLLLVLRGLALGSGLTWGLLRNPIPGGRRA